MTIEIRDLNLTDAVEAAAVKFVGEKKWQHTDMLTRQNVKQQLLEMLLPTLPHLIKQIGSKVYREAWTDAGRLPEPTPYDDDIATELPSF